MKDWIIDIEQKGRGAKGLRDAYGYMLDPNRPSHYHTDIAVLGDNRAFQNTVLEFEALNQKGRKINNFATSAMLSMPNDLIHPSVEEWEKIADELLKNYVDEVNSLQDRKLKAVKSDQEIIKEWQEKQIKMELPEFSKEDIEKKLLRKRKDEAKYLNQRLNIETLKETTGLIIHNEKNGKASHLNVLISNIQDGEYKKVITQYGGVNALKKAYNKAVLDVLGLDNRYYTPKESRLENQPAYDPKKPFNRRKLVPETVERNGKKVRGKRRRKKPFAVAQAEKKEAERIALLEISEKNKVDNLKNENSKKILLENKEIIIKAKSKVIKTKEKQKEKEKILNNEKLKIIELRKKAKVEINNGKVAREELKGFLNNLLSDDFLRDFWTGVKSMCKRNNINFLTKYEDDKKSQMDFKKIVLDKMEQLEPGAIEKFKQEEIKAKEVKAKKIANRHVGGVFKDEEEFSFEIQKETLKNEVEKKSIWKRIGLVK